MEENLEKAPEKIIRITVTGTASFAWDELRPFQGDLKTLSEENYRKLRAEIIDLGYNDAVDVWQDKGRLNIIDGHQGVLTVERMVNQEGWKCPPLPVNYVEAKSFSEARRIILGRDRKSVV